MNNRISALVVWTLAVVLGGLAVVQVVCAIGGFAFNASYPARPGLEQLDAQGPQWMLVSAAVTAAAGGILALMSRQLNRRAFGKREGMLSVALVWMFVGLFGAVPYVLEGHHPVHGVFESLSGFTTTGSTIMTSIETQMSRTLLLWRATTQWLGGMGIIVLFVSVLPGLGVGGRHMFRSEVPGATTDGLAPRIRETSAWLWRIYVLLTVLCALSLYALGMSFFDAIAHALTTIATGGFSTYDSSIAAFDSQAIEWVLSVWMLLSALNFALYYKSIHRRNFRAFAQSSEFRVYVGLVFSAFIALTVAQLANGMSALDAIRSGVFTTATMASSTGYAIADVNSLSAAALVIFMVLMIIGGCSGSTAGGVKLERIIVMFRLVWGECRRTFRPHVVNIVRLNGQAVEEGVLRAVSVYLFVFTTTVGAVMMALLVLEPIAVDTAFGAALTIVANMGPAPFHEGADNFAGYGVPAKLMLSGAMVLGRLEFFTLIAMLLPDFWRR